MNMELYYTCVLYIMTGIVGLCVGSFLNVVIYRTPIGLSVAKPASHCPNCKSTIKWYDNIPVLSYILLGAKCRKCKIHIPFRYTAVEILNAVLWLLSVRIFIDDSIIKVLIALILSSVLICVFFIDLENYIILDRFQIILLVLAVAVTVIDSLNSIYSLFSHLIAGVLGFGITLAISVIVSKIVKREAFGGGDIKLCGIMGLFLGVDKFLLAIIIASVGACLVILVLKMLKKDKSEYPFAPFLSLGFVVSVFFGDLIVNTYLSLLYII